MLLLCGVIKAPDERKMCRGERSHSCCIEVNYYEHTTKRDFEPKHDGSDPDVYLFNPIGVSETFTDIKRKKLR